MQRLYLEISLKRLAMQNCNKYIIYKYTLTNIIIQVCRSQPLDQMILPASLAYII